jgi:hypothetical protein
VVIFLPTAIIVGPNDSGVWRIIANAIVLLIGANMFGMYYAFYADILRYSRLIIKPHPTPHSEVQ